MPLYIVTTALLGIVGSAAVSAAEHLALETSAMTAQPCASPAQPNLLAARSIEALLAPGAVFELPARPALETRTAAAAALAADWASICRYRAENAAVLSPPDLILFGDSISEFWAHATEDRALGNMIGRGIRGQTSAQMLVRFHADVIRLRPKVVHIMAGTNDLSGNTGPTTFQDYQNNIMAMVALAQRQDIAVLIASIPPADRYWWAPQYRPAIPIQHVNAWLRTFAAEQGVDYVDYHAVLRTPDGALDARYSNDGVHPNRDGYKRMQQVLAPILRRRLTSVGESAAGVDSD